MGEYGLYIGCKMIKAIACDRPEFEREKGSKIASSELHGYKLIYPDGYISWSPRSVFEANYRKVSEDEKMMVLRSIPCECETLS